MVIKIIIRLCSVKCVKGSSHSSYCNRGVRDEVLWKPSVKCSGVDEKCQ